MGPDHPCWKYALEEVESLLQQAGRVYDEETVIAIAIDGASRNELALDASENMELRSQQLKYAAMSETIANSRKGQ